MKNVITMTTTLMWPQWPYPKLDELLGQWRSSMWSHYKFLSMFVRHRILRLWTLIMGQVFVFILLLFFYIPSYFCNLLCLLLLHLIVLTRHNIRACWALGRPILALEVDSEIFDEVLKPLFEVELGENIVKSCFNLDDNSPIQKKARINLNCE